MSVIIDLRHLNDTMRVAAILAAHIPAGIVFLQGQLGAGKTTLTGAWLNALGIVGPIKSPTYTLVEPYVSLAKNDVYHFDLYRLHDPFELELLGIRDYMTDAKALLLIEWPEKGEGVLPSADVTLSLSQHPIQGDDQRVLTVSCRDAALTAAIEAALINNGRALRQHNGRFYFAEINQ